MPPNYLYGDVVLVHFKFSESNETKLRPAVILEDLENETFGSSQIFGIY